MNPLYFQPLAILWLKLVCSEERSILGSFKNEWLEIGCGVEFTNHLSPSLSLLIQYPPRKIYQRNAVGRTRILWDSFARVPKRLAENRWSQQSKDFFVWIAAFGIKIFGLRCGPTTPSERSMCVCFFFYLVDKMKSVREIRMHGGNSKGRFRGLGFFFAWVFDRDMG